MKINFSLTVILLSTLMLSCGGTIWEDVPEMNPPQGAIIGKPGEETDSNDEGDNNKTFINSSYIRGDFYEINRVSTESMAACNDLIYLAPRPWADGELSFDNPDATGTVKNTEYLNTFEGRKGVLKFKGNSKMICGSNLLCSASGPLHSFTFSTWINFQEWNNGAYIFRKANSQQKNSEAIALKLGTKNGEFKLIVNNKTVQVNCQSISLGKWHYINLIINKGTANITLDNEKIDFDSNVLDKELPNVRDNFEIGENIKASFDETSVSILPVNNLSKNPITFNNWNMGKTIAYWKYDNASKPGQDSHSWVTRINKIKEELTAQPGERKFRLGFAQGEWKKMITSSEARLNFARNIKKVLDKYNLDGADLDFEWAYNQNEFDNYSKAIIKIREILGNKYCFTVSLHPVSYKISQKAIDACDFISLQCYGPSVKYFSYEAYTDIINEVIKYGIPATKLVPGVPFFATTGKPGEQVAYYDLVNNGGLLDSTIDKVSYKGTNYVFNGKQTIRKKTQYIVKNNLKGLMSWDLATDVTLSNNMSLLKTVKEEFEIQK